MCASEFIVSFRAALGVCKCGVPGRNVTVFKAKDGLWCCKTIKNAWTLEKFDKFGFIKVRIL